MCGSSAVVADNRVIQVGGTIQLPLMVAAGLSPGGMRSCTDGTDWCDFAVQTVVVVLEAEGTMFACIEADVGGPLEAASKHEQTFQCYCGRLASYYVVDHGESRFAFPIACSREVS